MFDQDLHQLMRTARRHHHRRLIIVSGSHPWCVETAVHILQEAGENQLWIGERPPHLVPALTADRARRMLGRELNLLVFDTHFGFDPDALGASVGAVVGGGLVVLLTHAVEDLPLWPDPENRRIAVAGYDPGALTQRYLQRVLRELEADRHLWWLREHHPRPPLPAHRIEAAPHPLTIPPYRTPDQAEAVAAIRQTALEPAPCPTVLTADRGRGKTAALGIAAAQLMREQGMRIVVTAPRRDAIEPLLEHAKRLLPHVEAHEDVLRAFEGELDFLPPDRLLHSRPECDVLFVDEAAAIPAPLLATMLEHYPRIVFATTVHGYEGTGRGFALRFQRLLRERAPDYLSVNLKTPIRWAADDPVEALMFRLLLLDACAAPDGAVESISPEDTSIGLVDRDRLVDDEALLRELYGLLVVAHYRTTPLDLRHLLDGPNLSVYVQRWRGHVVATALVAREGGFDEETAWTIWAGRRRPRGHLVAQALSAYLGLEEAPQHHFARILRIAVHPGVRRRGFGKRLVEHVAGISREEGIDCLGSSFGATPDLLDFWTACGCQTVRIGMRRDASSGEHSALVLRALSRRGDTLLTLARERFHRNVPVWREDPLADLDPALVEKLRAPATTPDESLNDRDWRDLVAFAFALRGYEMVQRAAERLARRSLNSTRRERLLTGLQERAVACRVLERCSWRETVRRLELSGRREAVELVRAALRPLILRNGPEWVGDLAEKARRDHR